MQPVDQIDSDSWLAVNSPEFAARFGGLLATTRRRSKRSLKDLAATGDAGFDAAQLRRFEQGSTPIDEPIVEALCVLYAADIGLLLPRRRPVTIAEQRLFGTGSSVEFASDDPTSLLTAYLRLITRMRNQRAAPAVALRRDDILVLAHYLGIEGSEVVARLAALINATPVQRSTMAMLFAAGAIVIGLTAAGHATAEGASPSGGGSPSAIERELVVAEVAPDLMFDGERVITDVATAAAGDVAPATPPHPPIASTVGVSPVAARVRASAPPPVRAPVPVATAAPDVAPRADVATDDTPETVPATVPVDEVATPITEPEPDQQGDPPPAAVAPSAAAEPEAVAVIAEVADVAGLSPATRLQGPVDPPAATVGAEVPTANQSGCNPDPSAAVMSLVIPDIAYSCPVYAGGQSMIDAGFVTLVTDAGVNPVLALRPGEPGTLWLAGHRSTHGAAFAHVPDLVDGALVTVTSDGATATYQVVGRAYVEVRGDRVVDASGEPTAEATWASIIRDDLSGNLAPRLVLQTCEGEHFRWMIYADLIT